MQIKKICPLDDDISFVEYLDHMGSDLSVVNAARVSMSVEHKTFEPKDEKLIQYLASHGHWTPFSHPQISFRIKMPIYVARQWYRSNVGITRNEVSRRYVNHSPQFHIPTTLRSKADNVKQGSGDVHKDSDKWVNEFYAICGEAYNMYQDMIVAGICPEQARIILPLATYTEFIETASLAAYARIVNLRLDPHTQAETQKYAKCIDYFMKDLFPVSWKALRHE